MITFNTTLLTLADIKYKIAITMYSYINVSYAVVKWMEWVYVKITEN